MTTAEIFRLLVLPDLHLDRWLPHKLDPLARLSGEELASIDLCIVSGDLTDKARVRWPGALNWLGERIDPGRIHVFEGNHDHYGGNIDDGKRLAEIAAAHGVGYAQQTAIIRGGHRFLCCTLWTTFSLNGDRVGAMFDAERVMNDYKKVRVGHEGYRRLYPAYTKRLHAEHRAWLERQLAEPFDGETTVVTHHAPQPSCVPTDAIWAPAYASDLTDVMTRYRPTRWLYGHTHRAHRTVVAETEIQCMSVGRPGEQNRPNGPPGATIIELPTSRTDMGKDDDHG